MPKDLGHHSIGGVTKATLDAKSRCKLCSTLGNISQFTVQHNNYNKGSVEGEGGMCIPCSEYEKFSLAVTTINSLVKKKFVCHGAKVASMFFLSAAILGFVMFDLFTIAYGATTLAGLGYLVATRYSERIDRKILVNVRLLEHLQGKFLENEVLAKER